MRILFFNEGNLGAHILGQAQLERTLRAHATSVDAVFATLPPQGRLAHAAIQHRLPAVGRAGINLRTLRWHLVQPLRARRAIAAAVAREHPDVLHVHSHSVALGLGRLMGCLPVALSLDTTIGDWTTMPAWAPSGRAAAAELTVAGALERRALQRAALVLAWTDWARRRALAAAPDARVVEHHPGLDLEYFAPAPRRASERPRVLFIGGRFEGKGGPDLLAALEPELGRTVDVDLVTPADVAPRPGVRVHRLGPDDPELLELRRQAALLCLPSYGDAAPWAVLEAMACGTPVVASDIGGVADLLGHGEAGVLVPVGDRAALREALMALLGDEPRRTALGTAARERCERRYDARRQTAALLDLLGGLMPPAPRPARPPAAARG